MTLDVDHPLAPEIVWWTPSEAYFENHSTFREHAKNWREAGDNVILGSYHGAQVDVDRSHVWVTVWKSIAVHQDFMQSEAYPELVIPLMEAMAGTGKITQVLMEGVSLEDIQDALSAPVTQFIYVTMRHTHDRDNELTPLIEELQQELRKPSVCVATCWGPSVEKEKLYVGITGWRSLDDRKAAVDGPLKSVISRIRQLSSVELRYSSLLPTADQLD